MRLSILGFLIFAGLLSVLSLACQQNYSVAPLTTAGSGSVGSPTPTPNCNPVPQVTPVTAGVDWAVGGVAEGSNYGGSPFYYSEVYLMANGVAVTNADVTLTGPGLSPLTLAYNGPITLSGSVYSDYVSAQIPGLLTAGVTYTLTTMTSAGTAYANVTMPNWGSLAADGSAATFSGPAMYTSVNVYNSSYSLTYMSGNCGNLTSPFSIPASAYPSSGTYYVTLQRNNYAPVIGGAGNAIFYSWDQISVAK